jgi:hypothetical protein
MDIMPVKMGFQTLWSITMQTGSAHELVRSAALASTLFKQVGVGTGCDAPYRRGGLAVSCVCNHSL